MFMKWAYITKFLCKQYANTEKRLNFINLSIFVLKTLLIAHTIHFRIMCIWFRLLRVFAINSGADPGEVKWVNFHPPFFWAPFFLKVVFRPFQFQEKEKTKSGYKHNKKVSHGIFNLTFHMLQHTSSEVTVTKYDEIWKDKN